MTFRECGKVSFPMGKLTFLKCKKRIQKTLLYAYEFDVLRREVPGKDAFRRRITVLFKRQFAIRAKCGFPLGKLMFSEPKKPRPKTGLFAGQTRRDSGKT